MTSRYAFRGDTGPVVATELLERLGGRRIVHGHSIVADQLGILPGVPDRPAAVLPTAWPSASTAAPSTVAPCLVVKLLPI